MMAMALNGILPAHCVGGWCQFLYLNYPCSVDIHYNPTPALPGIAGPVDVNFQVIHGPNTKCLYFSQLGLLGSWDQIPEWKGRSRDLQGIGTASVQQEKEKKCSFAFTMVSLPLAHEAMSITFLL
jgi:hypothetical protein